MNTEDLETKIFLDSGNPEETRKAFEALKFLDGQTTNPSFIAMNPKVIENKVKYGSLTNSQVLDEYKSIVKEISGIIPRYSVSIEVNANESTSAGEMIVQAEMMYKWIPYAHIKLPTIPNGLEAAEQLTKVKMRLNMTLCFTQEQAAQVYDATKGAKKGDVFVSPFIGRLDDKGDNGIDLIRNIVRMYSQGDGHVQVLSASFRNYNHFLASIQAGADIVTTPIKILEEWARKNLELPNEDFQYNPDKAPIPYKEIDLNKPWRYHRYKDPHGLISSGVQRFYDDWNSLLIV